MSTASQTFCDCAAVTRCHVDGCNRARLRFFVHNAIPFMNAEQISQLDKKSAWAHNIK